MGYFCMELMEGMPWYQVPAFHMNRAREAKKMGKEIKKVKATDEQIREAGSYAFQYIRPRRFLKEIDTDTRSELHLFGKWENSDPDTINFTLPSGEVKPLAIKPLDVVVVDKVKKCVYRLRPTKDIMEDIGQKAEFGGKGNGFPLLVHRSWGTFSELKHAVNQLISLYLKQKYFDGELRGEANQRKVAVEANKVMGGRFNHGIPVMRKIFGGKLWQRLDPEIAKLTIQICGGKATSLDYTIIWNNIEEVKDTIQKAPGILPVWINLCKRLIMKHDTNSLFVYSENFPISTNFQFPNIIQTTKEMLECKKFWVEAKPKRTPRAVERIDDEDFINQLQRLDADDEEFDEGEMIAPRPVTSTVFQAEGKQAISPRAWRYLIKLKPGWTRKICGFARDVPAVNGVLELFAAADVVPRFTILKPLVQHATRYQTHSPIAEAFVRAVVARTKKMTGIKHFWDAEGSLVMDWLNREEGIAFNKQQLTAPWSWWMRKQVEWHERIQRVERDALAKENWDCILPEFEYKGYVVVPLTTSMELFDEGKEMHHCVASYSKQCLLGKSRIFSIRISDMKIATAEIKKESFSAYERADDKSTDWSLSQTRGKCNATVPPEVEAVAKQIAKRYNEALKAAQYAEAV